ncbi:MAG: hypothetical protein ACTSYU_10350, partial [Promethearchaeota archaeon]
MKNKHVLLISTIVITFILVNSTIGSSYKVVDENCIGGCPQIDYSYNFKISASNGEMYFYPGGMVTTEVGGTIKLTYNGEYSEWGVLQS